MIRVSVLNSHSVRIRCVAFLVLVGLVAAVLSACGSNGGAETVFTRINPDEIILDLASFDPAGFKKAKEYDVAELPNATAVYMGYFTPFDSQPVQYEVRFYPDHSSVIESGVSYAEEVTGEDGLLRSADVRWKEGTKDRRGGGAFRGQLTPLYGDFAVIGNIILLCEGRSSEQSLERCEALLAAAGIGTEG